MPYFRVSAKSEPDKEAYWLYASTPEDARALVASNVPEDDAAREAQDATKYDCLPDETKTPPRRFIYRKLDGPIEIR